MVMSLGLGGAMSGSWRQKLNTGSSTEVELVGINDALKYIMWGLYFLQDQGLEIKKNILMQDKKSTILMATNGRFLCSKCTKHIKNRYFMIKDKVGKGEVIITHNPGPDLSGPADSQRLHKNDMGKDEGYLRVPTPIENPPPFCGQDFCEAAPHYTRGRGIPAR